MIDSHSVSDCDYTNRYSITYIFIITLYICFLITITYILFKFVFLIHNCTITSIITSPFKRPIMRNPNERAFHAFRALYKGQSNDILHVIIKADLSDAKRLGLDRRMASQTFLASTKNSVRNKKCIKVARRLFNHKTGEAQYFYIAPNNTKLVNLRSLKNCNKEFYSNVGANLIFINEVLYEKK